MANIILDEIPKSYYTQRLNRGVSARCYVTDTGDVFKKYYQQIGYVNMIRLLSEFKSDMFVFPRDLVFLRELKDENFVGYLMRFAQGQRFDSLDENIKIRPFIKHMLELEREMLRLTEQGIIMEDLNQGNIFYDKEKGFTVVDTDLFDVTLDDSFKQMYRESIKDLAESVVSQLIGLGRYENKAIQQEVFNCAAHGNIRPSTMLERIIAITEQECPKVETLGDFDRNLTLMKVLK